MGGDMLSVLLAIQGDASGAISALGQVQGRMDTLTSKNGQLSAGLTVLGGAMTGVGAAGGSFLMDATRGAAEFEQGVDTLQNLMASSGESAESLKQTALDLGQATSFSATESLDVMKELYKAGVDTEAIMGGAARATLDLATATETDAARSVEVMSAAMNVFSRDLKAQGKDAEYVANLIAQSANASAIDVNDFGYSLSMVGAVAAQIGLPIEDTANAIALLGKNGLKGSDAGTSLKTMLTNLVPKTNKAAEAFDALGLRTFNAQKAAEMLATEGYPILQDSMGRFSVNGQKGFESLDAAANYALTRFLYDTGQVKEGTKGAGVAIDNWIEKNGLLQNSFFDATGSVRPLAEIAGVLQEKLAGLTDEERVQALYSLFGSDAIRAGSILFTEGAAGVDAMNQAMSEQMDINELATNRMDNMAGSMELLNGSWETAKVIIGGFIGNALRPLVDGVRGLVDMFLSAPPEVQTFIGAVLGIGTAALAIGGPLVMLAGLWPIIAGGLGAVAGVLGSILLPITAIAGGVFLLWQAWENNWFGIRDILTGVWTSTIQPMLSQLTGWLQVQIPQAIQFLQQVWATIWPIVQEVLARVWNDILAPIVARVIEAFQNEIPGALGFLQQAWQTVWGFLEANVIPILTNIYNELSRFWTEISPKLQDVWNFISKTLIPTAMEWIGNIVNGGMTLITGIWNNAWGGIQQTLSGVWDMIKGIVEIAWGIVSGIIETGLNLLTGDWEGAWEAIKGAAGRVWQGIQDLVKGGIEFVNGIISTVLGTLKGIWDTFWNWAGGFITATWNNIKSGVDTAINNVKSTIEGVLNGIKTTWETMWTNIGNFLSTTWTNIKTSLETAWNNITTWFTNLPGQIWNTVVNIGRNIIDGIGEGIKNAWNGLVEWLGGMVKDALPQFIKDWLGIQSPSTVMDEEVGQFLPAGIQQGAEAAWPGLNTSMQTQLRGTLQVMGATLGEMQGIVNPQMDTALQGLASATVAGLANVKTEWLKTFGRNGEIDTLMFGRNKETDFFAFMDSKTTMALEWSRINVWGGGLQKLGIHIGTLLTDMKEATGQEAYMVGENIGQMIADGIISKLGAIGDAVGQATAAATPGGGAGGTDGGGGGGTTNIYNNVRTQYVDNSSMAGQQQSQQTQARYRG